MTEKINKKQRAIERLNEMRVYYGHLVTYLGVNVMISFVKIVRNLRNGETLGEAVWDFATFALWLFWGIGLLFHTVKMFSVNPFYGKAWEKRQLQKFMEQERNEIEKYK